MAKYYNVSYPTIRLRLDKLIQKASNDPPENDTFISLVKQLTLDGEVTYEAAKKLINSHRKEQKQHYESVSSIHINRTIFYRMVCHSQDEHKIIYTYFGSPTYRFANWIILCFAFNRFSDYIHPPSLGTLFDRR